MIEKVQLKGDISEVNFGYNNKLERHDIALSFAGEDREIAENIAGALIIVGVKVFYDRFHKIDMWGKKLTTYFSEVYGPKARFVMPLISKHYPIKDWTDFEFSIARKEAKKRKEEFILPVKLDRTKVVGIHEDVGYLDYETEGIAGIVDAVLRKLSKTRKNISKGIFVTTLGVNFQDLLEKQILSDVDLKDYLQTGDKLETDLKAKLDKSSIGEYHFMEPSSRNGETLSVRFAHYWDLSWGLPEFSFLGYWDFLEFRPVEEIYPNKYKEIKSKFKEPAFEKGEIEKKFSIPEKTNHGSIKQAKINGRWIDRADGDNVFFQQRGNRVVGIYDYDGRKSKVGFYIGIIKGCSFKYEWKWYNGEYHGHGQMTVLEDSKTMFGLWWYGDIEKSPEHVGYEYIDDKMPSVSAI